MRTQQLSSAVVPPLPLPNEPIHDIVVGSSDPRPLGAWGRLDIRVELRDAEGHLVRTMPHSRSRIQLSLEPPSAQLVGRSLRQTFAGQARFGLRIEPAQGRFQLRATVVDSDLSGLSSHFEVQPSIGPLPAPSPIPAQLGFGGRIDDVKVNQQWQVPIKVMLQDSFGQICPTHDDEPILVEVRQGRFGGLSDQDNACPLLGQQVVQNGIATFSHLRAPAEPGTWMLLAKVTVPQGGAGWQDIADDEDPDVILQEVRYMSQLALLSNPFRALP